MKNPPPAVTNETLLYLSALGLALALRLINLGGPLLGDQEASAALQALAASRGAPFTAAAGASAAYTAITGGLFALFGASNGLARLFPALCGALLPLVPALLLRPLPGEMDDHGRAHLRLAGIIMAFGLALDPGLTAAARQAHSSLPAISMGLLALGGARRGWRVLSGVAFGLALLAGPSFWIGALTLTLAWMLAALMERRGLAESLVAWRGRWQAAMLEPLALSAGLTAVLVGSLLFLVPSGWAGLFDGLVRFVQGWFGASGTPALQMPLALVVYQPLALIFALVAVGRGLTNRSPLAALNDRFLLPAFWAALALTILLLYSGRQMSDLGWVLTPLWLLAALELAHYPLTDEVRLAGTSPIAALHAGIIVILLGLFWYTLATFSQGAGGVVQPPMVQAAVVAGIGLLIALTSLLFALGWSWSTSRLGLTWGLSAGLSLYLLATVWGASQLRPNAPQELFAPQPGLTDSALLPQTLHTMSAWTTGRPTSLELLVTDDRPSLRWLVRDFPNATFLAAAGDGAMPVLPSGSQPAALLTSQNQAPPEAAQAYRGQDFAWDLLPGWPGLIPTPGLDWLTYRRAPLVSEQLILWVRSDLFPSAAASEPAAPAPASP